MEPVPLSGGNPWGMSLAGIEKEGDFTWLFNLSEKQPDATGSGYSYETGWRGYDPQTGRFRSTDMLAASMPGISPYQYAYNNPVMLNDPTGLAVLPMVTVYAFKTTAAHTVAAAGIRLAGITLGASAAGAGMGGCNCACPDPPCGGQAAQMPQAEASQPAPRQALVPPAGFAGVGRPANAVAARVAGSAARMLLRGWSLALSLLTPTAAGPALPDGQYSEIAPEPVRPKQWDFNGLSPEELRDIADRASRGLADAYDRQVSAWLQSGKSNLAARISGKLNLYPNIVDSRYSGFQNRSLHLFSK